jgi:hypothetical protein
MENESGMYFHHRSSPAQDLGLATTYINKLHKYGKSTKNK